MSGHLAKNAGGHLMKNAAGHLVKCAGCVCSVLRNFPTCRPCLEVAYGTPRGIDTLTWTISGTPFVYENRQGGLPYVPLNGSSPSVNGTYILSCNTNQEWWHCAHVGTRTFGVPSPVYYYYSMRALFTWSLHPTMPSLTIWSGAFSNTTGVNPYPTLAVGTAPAINQNEATRVVALANPGLLDDWVYELGGGCLTSCNSPATRPKCPLATPSLDVFSPAYAHPTDKHNHVEVGDLTITAAVALL